MKPELDVFSEGLLVMVLVRGIERGALWTLLNASNHKSAYTAFRYDQDKGHPFKSLKKEQFNKYVEAIINKHTHLEQCLATDQGVRLMYIDSQIIEQIISVATSNNIPILTVHDSVICRERDEFFVRDLMKEATKQVLGVELGFDVNRETVPKALASNTFRDIDFTSRLFDSAREHEAYQSTDYHKQQWNRFQKLGLRQEG